MLGVGSRNIGRILIHCSLISVDRGNGGSGIKLNIFGGVVISAEVILVPILAMVHEPNSNSNRVGIFDRVLYIENGEFNLGTTGDVVFDGDLNNCWNRWICTCIALEKLTGYGRGRNNCGVIRFVAAHDS